MSFILPKATYFPVFDIPTTDIYKTEFVDRRIATVAGKSVFSEKNQPIKPSRNNNYKKCYVANHSNLYKYNSRTNIYRDKTHEHKMILYIESDYYIPISYFFINRKLKLINYQYKIITGISNNKKNQELAYNSSLNPININKSFLYSSNNLKLKKLLPFSRNNFPFKFQFSDYSKTTALLHSFKNKITNKDNNFIAKSNYIVKTLSLNKDVIQPYIYDFTSFAFFQNKMYILEIRKHFIPSISPTNIKTDFNVSNESIFPCVNHLKKDFESVHNKFKDNEFFSTEIFAKFYITVPIKLIPIDRNTKINNTALYSLDIPSYIANKKVNLSLLQPTINNHETFIKSYLTFNNTVLTYNKISKFNGYIEEKSKNNLKEKQFNASRTNSFIINLKNRKPRLALKLSIKKPKFVPKQIDYTLSNKREIDNKILYQQVKKIKANIGKIIFNHKSPSLFQVIFREDAIDDRTNYVQRRYIFFNKSPKHAIYSYKKLNNIITTIPLKKKKAISIPQKSLIEQDLKYKSFFNKKYDYTYNFLDSKKVAYIQKITSDKIICERNNFKGITYSNKVSNKNKTKDPINNFTLRKRIGLNHIKKLKSILSNNLFNKAEYNYSYLKAQKRIKLTRLKEPLKKNLFSLNILKNIKGIFNDQKKALDAFEIKYINSEFKYCPYLPKQIVNSFSINFDIIGIKRLTNLIQKDIIPPPGWKKLWKKYFCRLKLGPYPFGFPKFSIVPPIFATLATRNKYSIKDIKIENIFRESFFILTKSKLYLPELSMKNPKRLLYEEITPKNSPKEYYRSKTPEPLLQQDQPQKISSFNYSWNYYNSRSYISNQHFTYYLEKTTKNKKVLFKTKVDNYSLHSINISRIPITIKSFMPKINRLNIKNERNELNPSLGKIVLNGLVENIIFHFSMISLNHLKPIFLYKELFSSLRVSKIWTFSQIIEKVYPANEILPTYTTRFRTFHFPYVPEYKLILNKSLTFSKDVDYTSYYSCKFQEDFRTSQFEFGSIEIQNQNCRIFNFDNEKCIYDKPSFSANDNNIIAKAYNCFIQPFKYIFKAYKKDNPSYYKHLITPRFFKLKENFSYKYMRRGKMLSTIKYIPISKLPLEKYIDIKFSIFNSMESPSFHWIILLRRNNTVLDKTQYITRLRVINKKSPSIFNLLSRFENEEYKSTIISNPTIQSIQRNILANLDKDSKMNISNNYFTNLDNIKKNFFFIVPNIYLKNKLKSNEKIRLFDFKLQGIKEDKKEIKEPNKLLEYTLKGKLKLSAFIFDREKRSFASFTSSHPKRLAYSPVYIADFIDIQEIKENNLEIRM